MSDVMSPENVTVDYDQLDPAIHRAVGRIVTSWADSSFRVDDIEPHQLDGIRDILRQAEGSRLPDYHYDEQGEYVRMGSTPVIEERHTRVAMHRQEAEQRSLWLRVPRFSEEARVQEVASPENFKKKDLAIFGSGSLAVNGLLGAGIAANKPGLVVAAFAADVPLASYLLYRTKQVFSPVTARA